MYSKNVRLLVNFTAEMANEIRRLADENERSIQGQVRHLLRWALEHLEQETGNVSVGKKQLLSATGSRKREGAA